MLGNLLARHRLQTLAIVGGLPVSDDFVVSRLQPVDDLRHDLRQLRLGWLRHQGYDFLGLRRGHQAPVVALLYRVCWVWIAGMCSFVITDPPPAYFWLFCLVNPPRAREPAPI